MAENEINLMNEVSHLLLGVVSGTIGLLIGLYFTKRKEKVSVAFDLHKELNSTEMSKHRHVGGELIRKYSNTTMEEIEKIDPEKSVYVIMRFYPRL